MSSFSMQYSQRNLFGILLDLTEIRLYLPCTDWFGTANGHCPFAVPNWSVHGKYNLITVWFNRILKIFPCMYVYAHELCCHIYRHIYRIYRFCRLAQCWVTTPSTTHLRFYQWRPQTRMCRFFYNARNTINRWNVFLNRVKRLSSLVKSHQIYIVIAIFWFEIHFSDLVCFNKIPDLFLCMCARVFLLLTGYYQIFSKTFVFFKIDINIMTDW